MVAWGKDINSDKLGNDSKNRNIKTWWIRNYEQLQPLKGIEMTSGLENVAECVFDFTDVHVQSMETLCKW